MIMLCACVQFRGSHTLIFFDIFVRCMLYTVSFVRFVFFFSRFADSRMVVCVCEEQKLRGKNRQTYD